MSFTRLSVVILSLLLMAGCSIMPKELATSGDPWERYNRSMHAFNDDFDEYVAVPVAEGYQTITPEMVDQGISNFFGNLLDVNSAVNNLLQWKPDRAVNDVVRIMINTSFGLLGFVDLASQLELPSYKEDFGQTLGYWGLESGPYFVLPVLGPNSVRDTFGLIVDVMINPTALIEPFTTRAAVNTLYYVDMRADLLDEVDLMKEAAIDPYSFMRDSYLQYRVNQVYDGNPPYRDDDPFEDELFEDELNDMEEEPEPTPDAT